MKKLGNFLFLFTFLILLPAGGYYYLTKGKMAYLENREFLTPKGKLPAFEMTDAMGNTVRNDSLAGKFFVANFFRAGCKGDCLKMNEAMANWLEVFNDRNDVAAVSHVIGSDSLLAGLADEFDWYKNANSDQWKLVGGSEEELAKLALDGYRLREQRNRSEENWLDDPVLILMDDSLQVRAFFNCLQPDSLSQLIYNTAWLFPPVPKPKIKYRPETEK